MKRPDIPVDCGVDQEKAALGNERQIQIALTLHSTLDRAWEAQVDLAIVLGAIL